MSYEPDRQASYEKLVEMLKESELLSTLTEEQIVQMALAADYEFYKSGETILRQGAPGNQFFFILDGQVRVIDTSEHPARLIAYLHHGDFFGERALLFDIPNVATKDVIVDTHAAIFDKATWNWLITTSPVIADKFRRLEERYEAQSHLDFPGRQQDEVVVRNVNRHVLAFIAKLPGPLLLVIFGLALEIFLADLDLYSLVTVNIFTILIILLGILWIIYLYVDWVNDDFIVTTDRVVHIERTIIYGESREEAPLTQIQDVSQIVPNFFTGFFGYSHLLIKTAGAGDITFDGIKQGDLLRRDIFDQREQAQERVEASDTASIRKSLADRMKWEVGPLEPSALVSTGSRSDKPESQTFKFLKYYIPQVKEEKGDMITWRKHYFVLLQHITLPLIVGFVLFYFIIAAMSGLFPFSQSGSPAIWPLIVAWLIVAVWYTYQYETWRKDEYHVTNTAIIDYKGSPFGLRGEEKRQGTFDVIQNTTFVSPSFIAQILNVGDVVIETAGTADTFTFKEVYNPKGVQQEIFRRWVAFQENERRHDREVEERRFTRWLGEYHDMSQEIESPTLRPSPPPA